MALWVLVYHASVLTGYSSRLLPPGAIAVDIFMFLSGLLMARNFIEREAREPLSSRATIYRFYVRRVFRVAPLYWLLFAVAVALGAFMVEWRSHLVAVFPPPYVDSLGNDPSRPEPTLANIVAHLTFLFGLYPPFASNNALPDWSLSLEMQFYVAVPFLMLAIRRSGVWPVVLAALALQWLATRYVGLYLTPGPLGLWPQPSALPFKIGCFLAGMLVAMLAEEGLRARLVVLVGLCCLGQSVIFCGVVGLVLLVMSREPAVEIAERALSTPLARWLGNVSYGVYLSHMMVLVPLASRFAEHSDFVALRGGYRFVILAAVGLAVTMPISYGLHRLVERPGIGLGRWLASRIDDRRAVLVAQPH